MLRMVLEVPVVWCDKHVLKVQRVSILGVIDGSSLVVLGGIVCEEAMACTILIINSQNDQLML